MNLVALYRIDMSNTSGSATRQQPSPDDIVRILAPYRFSTSQEGVLQQQIEGVLRAADLPVEREYRLTAADRPDFFVDGIAIEVKVRGGRRAIYRQCERYCRHPDVRALVLATSRAMDFPDEIRGIPCRLLALGSAWL